MNAWRYYDEWEKLVHALPPDLREREEMRDRGRRNGRAPIAPLPAPVLHPVRPETTEREDEEMTLSPETRDAVREGCKQSAAAVLPIVFDYLGTPAAILDVGAGEGHWIDAAHALGVHAIGLDVVEHGKHVWPWDAEALEPIPERDAGDWPLALCLEVAEHLTPAAGAHLIRELTRVSDAILWSAAIPGQGGDGHINERWATDWAEGFDSCGWHLEDPFRTRLWECVDVEPWYRQNLLLARPGRADYSEWPRNLVDPVTWAHHRGVPAP